MADWNEVSRGRPGWFLADGLHLTRVGERAYDALLRASVALCPEPVEPRSSPIARANHQFVTAQAELWTMGASSASGETGATGWKAG